MSLNFTTIFRGILLICFLIGAGFVIQNSDLSSVLSREWVDTNVRYTGIYGLILFLLFSNSFEIFEAIFVANAVFPIDGLPAIIIKSDL